MICKTCDQLLELYEHSVKLYSNSTRNLTGMFGDDLYRGLEKAQRLKQASYEASEDLMMHWRQKHSYLAISTED